MKQWRAKGWRSTKATKINNLQVEQIRDANGRRSATATYCVDATGVDVVDRSGKSVVAADRPNQFPTVMTLQEKTAGQWLAVAEKTEGRACDA